MTRQGYKGPIRDDQIAVRVSKATAEAFRKLCRARGKSQADVLIEWIERDKA